MTMVVPPRFVRALGPASAGSYVPVREVAGRDAILARYRGSVDGWISSAFRSAAVAANVVGYALEEEAVGVPIRHYLAWRRFTIRSLNMIMGQKAPVRATLHLALDESGMWSSDASATQPGRFAGTPTEIEHLKEADVQRAFKALLRHICR
jgi:hypothetical protein